MTIQRPNFLLRREYSDGSSNTPQLVPISTVSSSVNMGRRGFLGTSVAITTALTAMSGAAESVYAAVWGAGQTPIEAVKKARVFAHHDAVNSLAFSPDGKTLVSASGDSQIKVWNLPSLTLRQKLTAHTDCVNDIVFLDGNDRLVSGSSASDIRIWQMSDSTAIRNLDEHSSSVQAVDVTNDGTMMASGGENDEIFVWTLPDGRPITTLNHDIGSTRTLQLSSDWLIAAGQDGLLRQWSIPDGHLQFVGAGHESAINALSLLPSRQLLVAGDDIGRLTIRDRNRFDVCQTFTLHEKAIRDLVVSINDHLLVTVADDAKVGLWSFNAEGTLESRGTLECAFALKSVALSPDQTLLAAGDSQGAILLWKLANLEFLGFVYDQTICETPTVVEVDEAELIRKREMQERGARKRGTQKRGTR